MRFPLRFILTFILLAADGRSRGAETNPSAFSLGGARWQGWTGLDTDGVEPAGPEGRAVWTIPGQATYRVVDGPMGWSFRGLNAINDGTIDGRAWYGLRFEIELDRSTPLDTALTLRIPPEPERHNLLTASTAHIVVQGKGWQTVTVPFTSFDYNRGQVGFLKYIKELTLKGHYREGNDKGPGAVKLRDVRLVRGNVVHLASTRQSLPGEAGSAVTYTVSVVNTAETPQIVSLSFERTGWEAMVAEVSPRELALQPGESKTATVTVAVPRDVPPGSRESQMLLATPEGDRANPEKLELITLRRLPSPHLIFDKPAWADFRAKVARYDWAKEQAKHIVRSADEFEVPAVPRGGIPSDQGTKAVFKSYLEQKFWPCALAWKLTGEKKYAEKLALLLRRLADPENGYPKTLHANSQGIPQEGGFFEACARAYDAIQDAGVLTETDRQQIEDTFRLYITSVEEGMGDGGISNWSVFNLSPAALCALVVQDMHHFNFLMEGPCGIEDHLRYGLMDDGWWYEMSLSYNLGCAEALTMLGLAAEPFGIDLLNRKFPVALTHKVGLRPFEFENFLGMAFGKNGPTVHTTTTIKQMWDGIAVYPDYRGVMFGMGDGHEHIVSGHPFELAFYAYRDPAYASIVKQGKERDLLFGVPTLPESTPRLFTLSAHSDNAGVTVLRSQTPARDQREQIQVAFKYGTHGSYHGHFDRLSLLSLMRYGRSFYNPETSWFGYGSYMYKWWVQPSLAHNMVVVDAKQQEPQECRPLLFHSGKMLQAVAAETIARWSNPPYFGGYDQIACVKSGEAPFVAVPEKHPAPGELTDYTEPVRQRRVIVVTDDYVVMADDLHGEREHTFDHLLHLRGAEVPTSSRFLGHEAQFDTNPLGSGQFITNVDRYAVTAPSVIHSIHRFADKNQTAQHWETGGAKSFSEPGVLKIDEHVLWPRQAEIVLGSFPEARGGGKKITYEIKGDESSLKSGVLHSWILGSGVVDLEVSAVKRLHLQTRSTGRDDHHNSLFWGNPVIVTTEGKELPLSGLKIAATNILAVPEAGKDYESGPVRIAGLTYGNSLAAEPRNASEAAEITIDLTGLKASRFKTVVGGDWPVGDEEQLRKTVSVRSKGMNAQFLTLLEPYEDRPAVKSTSATGPGDLHVELVDGRKQDLVIRGLDGDGAAISVEIKEFRSGQLIRQEATTTP